MRSLTVELDEESVERLRRRAAREGVDPTELAARLLSEAAAEPDPYDFVGSIDSDVLGARDTDAFLAAYGFGTS